MAVIKYDLIPFLKRHLIPNFLEAKTFLFDNNELIPNFLEAKTFLFDNNEFHFTINLIIVDS